MIINNEHAYVSFIGRLAFCSNYYAAPLTFRHREYRTAEHAYQATKMLRPADHDAVAAQLTPFMAKQRARSGLMHPEWEGVKRAVMLAILRAKFENMDMRRRLLATRGEELVENNSWNDTYWGVCRGVGLNTLGKLLMQVRTECQLIGVIDPPKKRKRKSRAKLKVAA